MSSEFQLCCNKKENQGFGFSSFSFDNQLTPPSAVIAFLLGQLHPKVYQLRKWLPPPSPRYQNLYLGKQEEGHQSATENQLLCRYKENLSTRKEVKEKHKRFLIFFRLAKPQRRARESFQAATDRASPGLGAGGSRWERAQPGTGAARARGAARAPASPRVARSGELRAN